MGDDEGYGIIFGIGLFIGFLITALAFTIFGTETKKASELKREAIERNFAEFDSKTGEWQWIEKK